MADITLQHLEREVVHLKTELTLIKNILVEEEILTPWAKKGLAKAKAAPMQKYAKLKEL